MVSDGESGVKEKMKTKVLVYDWKDSVHELIADIEHFISEYKYIKSFYSVNSGGDSYTVVISDSFITKKEAYDIAMS